MRVVLAGSSSITNLGDQAILLCMMQDLRKVFGPDVRFSILTYYPDIARERLGHLPGVERVLPLPWSGQLPLNWRLASAKLAWFAARRRVPVLHGLARNRESIGALETADLVAFVGGRYLATPYFYPVLERLVDATIAARRGVPRVAWAQSIGPFATIKEKVAASMLLRRLDLVCARDEASFEFLRHFAVAGPRVERVADCVFNLEPAAREEVDRAMRAEGIARGARPLVAVTARTLAFTMERHDAAATEHYLEQMARACDEVATRLADMVFLSSTYRAGTYTRHDPDVGREIQKRMRRPEALKIVDREYPAPVVKGMYARMDAVVSTRMHPVIFASAAGVPVVGLAYEYKTVELFKLLGLEEHCSRVTTIDAATVVAQVARALERADEIRAHLARRIPELQAMAFRSAEATREIVEAGPRRAR